MPLRIDTVDVTHYPAKISQWRFNQEVIMVAHQAIGMKPCIKTIVGLFKRLKKSFVVRSRIIYPPPSATTIHHMVKSVLVLNAWSSWHTSTSNYLHFLLNTVSHQNTCTISQHLRANYDRPLNLQNTLSFTDPLILLILNILLNLLNLLRCIDRTSSLRNY